MRRGYSALEDVPMIVPIAASLILFFGALAWAVNTVNSTNSAVDLDLSLLQVADSFAQQGIITPDNFKATCERVRGSQESVYFVVVLSDSGTAPPPAIRDLYNTIPRNSSKVCTNASVHPRPGQHVIVRVFPVTYQEHGSACNRLWFLWVVVWPKA